MQRHAQKLRCDSLKSRYGAVLELKLASKLLKLGSNRVPKSLPKESRIALNSVLVASSVRSRCTGAEISFEISFEGDLGAG